VPSAPSLVALTFGVVLASPIGVPSAGADGCPDIEVVFARGTGEPPGVGSVGQAFIDSLRSKVGGRSVGQYAVNYAAPLLAPEAADHLAAVAAFGNPAEKLTGSMAGLPVYGGRTIDLCDAGDPICGSGGNQAAHNQYAGAQAGRAASFVAGLL
jgi:cutinase